MPRRGHPRAGTSAPLPRAPAGVQEMFYDGYRSPRRSASRFPTPTPALHSRPAKESLLERPQRQVDEIHTLAARQR